MADTPAMGLSLPEPQVTSGPEWAEALNTALEQVDQHSHVSGEGVPITPAAININDDLPFNGFSLTGVDSVLLVDRETDITDRGVYAKSGNLFYRNTEGDNVQITNGDSVAGATGTITGLESPAGAAFSSLTNAFAWTYDSSEYAKMVHSDLQLYPYDGSTAYTKAVTIKAPTDIESASSFSLTLPSALPSSGTEYLSIDSSGVLNHATLAGTTNQVNVSASATAITLSLPQSIHTAATPTFASLTTSGAIAAGGALTATSVNLTSGGAFKATVFNGSLAAGASATISVGSGKVIVGAVGYDLRGHTNFVDYNSGAPVYRWLGNTGLSNDQISFANDNPTIASYRVIVFYQDS